MTKKIGIMICGHGSRDKEAEQEFKSIANALKKKYKNYPVEYGFLEFSAPNIHMSLDKLVKQGVEKIIAVPGMLFAATHAKNDIPSVLTTYMEKNNVEIKYGSELGITDNMVKAFEKRIIETNIVNEFEKNYEKMLVVVGRGTSDTYANAEVAKLTRIIEENLSFGWASTVYSGVTFPSTYAGIDKLIKLDYKEIVVAPYFLFTGKLIKRIHAYVNKIAQENPNITFKIADYLNDQDFVINEFVEKIENLINSDEESFLMKDFKKRLANGEVELHHHHSEYRDETCESKDGDDEENHHHDHSHGHHHGHSHDNHSHHHHGHGGHHHDHSHGHHHGHSHPTYVNIAHPLGPRTMIGENLCCCFTSQFPDEIIKEELAKNK